MHRHDLRTNKHMTRVEYTRRCSTTIHQYAYSWILARISESRIKRYSSSPTLIWLPPHDGSSTLSPGFTLVGTTWPSLLGAPGPAAMTEASGMGVELDDEGRKMPVAVLVSGLKRWTSTRSRRGTTDLILRIVEAAADCER